MSLLLGARAKNHVVLLTDGISITQNPGKKPQVAETGLVKIFPSKTRPFALAHHGENRLGTLPVEKVLENLIPQHLDPAWRTGLNRTIARTIDGLDSSVSQRLKAGDQRKVSGFWVAGLFPCTEIAEIAEVIWIKSSAARVRVTAKPLGDLSAGGSGAKYVTEFFGKPFDEKFSYKKIMNEPAEYSIDFLKKLYAHALKAQKDAGETLFGGTARMALITEDGIDLDAVEIEPAP
ncbi:MAG: hypothetical protein HKN23_04355 [Verrucomicrobiales bacterium]|nr:hypothetical protein [Verrucomicrobiales bacterium]